MFVFVNTLGQTRLRASSHKILCRGEKNKGIPWESVELGQSQWLRVQTDRMVTAF